ncbi:MAG TPA: Hsp33 family molecular chaperone HslO [Terricaulis sp.]|nr:Hsp33 family molecular chaperone HslO [Terricaulis sp.]
MASMQDDLVAPFSLDHAPVRGRIARLGPAVNAILRRHDYPRPVALLLGEALTLAALVGSLLKSDGRLIVQAQGQGPAPLLVAECGANGALRGYARMAEGAAEALRRENRLPPDALLGAGNLVMTLDLGGDAKPYQGMVALDGDTLAACAERYFLSSEQTETRIALAVGEVFGEGAPLWRAQEAIPIHAAPGGALLQRIAADDARGDPAEDWSRATILFGTVKDEELIDPDLGADRVLYRLFHEEGVRMSEGVAVTDQCTCTQERLTKVMQQFPREELRDLIEPDGLLHAKCQFCAREYRLEPESVGA